MTLRRTPATEQMIEDHLLCTLACVEEMVLYGLYLQSCPSKGAALLVETLEGSREQQVQQRIQVEMREEWTMIVLMENNAQHKDLLHKACPFLGYYHVREIYEALAQDGWKLGERSRGVLAAWYPKFGFSSNVEDIFSNIEDSCRRGSKNNTANCSNLQCISIRALNRTVCKNDRKEDGPTPVHLSSEDFEGSEVRSLKPKLWKPDSFVSRLLFAFAFGTNINKTCVYGFEPEVYP